MFLYSYADKSEELSFFLNYFQLGRFWTLLVSYVYTIVRVNTIPPNNNDFNVEFLGKKESKPKILFVLN